MLVEYDPSKATYELMVEYAWRNLDPFDGGGQFCDRGSSYEPAIFYADEDEREAAERVRGEVRGDSDRTAVTVASSQPPNRSNCPTALPSVTQPPRLNSAELCVG